MDQVEFDYEHATPTVQKAWHAFKLAVAAADVLPAGPEREKFKAEALKCFFETQKTSLRTDNDAFSTYLHTHDHRTLYPGAVNVDLNRKKEKEFDAAYEEPDFEESLKQEFFMKAQAGLVDPAAVVVMGMTLVVNGPFAADDMRKRVHRLMASWLREPPATQGERYNFYKASELPEQTLLSASLGLSQLTVPLFPFHALTQVKSNELLMMAQSVQGGGTDQSASPAKGFFRYPQQTLWGSGYQAPVFNVEGQQVGTADLSGVETQFMKLQKQVARLDLNRAREVRRSVDRTISQLERKGIRPARATSEYRQDKRGPASRIHRGGAVDDSDNDFLNDLFPQSLSPAKNGSATTRQQHGS